MDRNLKERIIGAIVLVVFAILVVPIFLDGPPDESEIVSENVTLPGQSSQKMQTRVLERNRSVPVPTTTPEPEKEPAGTPIEAKPAPDSGSEPETTITMAKAEPEPDTKAASARSAPKPKPASKTEPVAQETSSTGMWAVQLGSFSKQANAEKLAADLRKQGFAAFLSKLNTDKGQLHRVRIGPQADRPAAEAVAKKLKAAGHSGQVVPHP